MWRVAVRPSYIKDARFLKVNTDDFQTDNTKFPETLLQY
jgi:hypothetical protein